MNHTRKTELRAIVNAYLDDETQSPTEGIKTPKEMGFCVLYLMNTDPDMLEDFVESVYNSSSL